MTKGNHIIAYLREISIVVIGVLIAVSAGNYKEKLDDKRYLKKTLVAIKNEVTTSRAEIDSVLKRHFDLYRKLEEDFGQNEQSLGEFVSSAGGFQVANIKNISLRFFVSNKAELLDFLIIGQLLDIELQTKLLSDKVDRLANFAYENVHQNDLETMTKFAYLLGDVIDSEQMLSEAYAEFLADYQMESEDSRE